MIIFFNNKYYKHAVASIMLFFFFAFLFCFGDCTGKNNFDIDNTVSPSSNSYQIQHSSLPLPDSTVRTFFSTLYIRRTVLKYRKATV